MKAYNALVLFVAMIFVGHVQSRVASGISVFGPTGNNIAHQCSHDGTNTTVETLLKKKIACFAPLASFKRQITTASTTSKYQQIIQRACVQAPEIRVCLYEMVVEATNCLNKMEAKLLKASRENANALISATCDDGSDSISRMIGVDFKALNRQGKEMEVMQCLRHAVAGAQLNGETDMAAFSRRKFRAALEVRKCVVDVAQEIHVKTNNFEVFFNKILSNMKCISPVTKEVVFCRMLLE